MTAPSDEPAMVTCVRCLDECDPIDDDVKTIGGEPVCVMCRKGREDQPALTAEEFERRYAEESGLTVEQLHAAGRYARPCDCAYELCKGWQMAYDHAVMAAGLAAFTAEEARFRDLPASDYPLVVEYLSAETGEVLETVRVDGPGVVVVPKLGHVRTRITYADGRVETGEAGA